MEGSSACASLGRRNQEPGGIPCTESDVEYFKAYDDIAVHEEMIKDRARTETYIAAIRKFQPVIEGKVVLDVGCGTGILAILCAYAGASRVYAVDASEIAIQADEIVKVNKLSGKVIVLHGRIEDVLIEEKVDVIISEWMGYMLLHESMLSSIIFARNKWFKKGGLILPSHAMLFMAPFTHSGRYLERIDFWKDVHGIDMSPMLTLAKQCAFLEPCVETIPRSNLLSWPTTVMEVNCHTVTLQELEHVTGKFRFISTSKAPLHGFAFWFNVIFDAGESPNPNARSPFIPEPNPGDPIVLYTAPGHNPTHWNQTLVYLFEPIELEQSQIIEGTVTLTQNMPYPRSWNISIAFSTGKQSFIVQSLMR